MTEFRWEEPPDLESGSSSGRTSPLAESITQLTLNPGKWALLFTTENQFTAASRASNIRTGKYAYVREALNAVGGGAFEVVSRKQEGTYSVYAKFNPALAQGGASAAVEKSSTGVPQLSLPAED